MPAEMSSAISQRLTLDHPSFEKLLAAAWVLQCLHDELRNQEIGREETIAEMVRTREPLKTVGSGLQAAIQTMAQPSPRVMGAESICDVPKARPAGDESFAEPVEAQPAVETGTLYSGAAVTAELKTAEPANRLLTEDAVHASSPLRVSEEPANDDEKERAWSRAAFNFRPANLRTAFSRTLNGLRELRPVSRVNLTHRALRTAAIAAPMSILALVAVLLLETWRDQPLHSAQAISSAIAPTAEVTVGAMPTNLSATTRADSDDTGRITHVKPNRPRRIFPRRSSHRQVTDPATLSVVQGLSKYEISGLRRRAKYGDAAAAFTLGMAYEIGRHVPQNCAQAAYWVMTAAEAGDAAAQYNLGLRYRDGDGLPANRTISEKWLGSAAARRNRQAKLALKMLASR